MPRIINIKGITFYFLLCILSGLLTGFSYLWLVPALAWFMLVPLFYSVMAIPGHAFYLGFVSGLTAGFVMFHWMIDSTGYYTGGPAHTGILLWLVAAVYFALVTGLVVWLFSLVQLTKRATAGTTLLNALFAATLWIGVDWFRSHLMPGIPWLHYQVGHTQMPFQTILQIASFTGLSGISFLLVGINVLFAGILFKRSFKLIWLPALFFLLFFLPASLRMFRVGGNPHGRPEIDVAILCENIEARQRWTPKTGDSLASLYFELNRQATRLEPDLILWSETAVPWDFAPDDDLILECLRITWPSQSKHLTGIMSLSENHSGKRYNSAYFFEPDGVVTARYDKVKLLTFIEKPLLGKALPFFNRSVYTNILPGTTHQPITTSLGKAGILICNESLLSAATRTSAKLNADFLVVMANNSWFEHSSLVRQHFYVNRLRAVETGRDMAINCNRGISGIIDAFGHIKCTSSGKEPQVITGKMAVQPVSTCYQQYGDWFIVTLFLCCVVLYILTLVKQTNHMSN